MKRIMQGIVVLSLAMMSACSSTSGTTTTQPVEDTNDTASALSFTPGTYTGSAQGMHSTITVDVTFSEDAITDITITDQNETRNVSTPALEMIPQRILESQSLAVDTISSVTMTSNGVINAVKDACEQAGGDLDVLTTKPETTKAEDETVEADVVVVGLGLAGVTASMSALDEGATVVAVEKDSVAGGSSKYSGGFITAVNSTQQQEMGYTLDVDGYMDYFNSQEDMSVKEDETDRDAVRAMIERSASDLQFLEDHGVTIAGPTGFGGDFTVWHYPGTRSDWTDGEAGGADHIIAGMSYLTDNPNFSVYYDTPATEILTDENGNVAGIKCTREDGSTLTVNAKSVVLSCGGFAASEELMERFAPDFPQEWVIRYTTASLADTGDGITMAEAVGADVYENGWWMDLAMVADVGGASCYFMDSLNGMVDKGTYFLVNGNGERILSVNAAYGPRSIAFAQAMQDTGAVYGIYSASGFANGVEYIEANDRVDNQIVYKADTLEELAELTGMDPEVLTQQVERYNGFCETGVDEDFGQMTLTPLDEGPYYAISIKTATMGSIGGLKTDDNNQVLNTEGTPIDGLYAAGELINGKYFNQVYVSGDAQLLCTDSGIIAGANAAQSALN